MKNIIAIALFFMFAIGVCGLSFAQEQIPIEGYTQELDSSIPEASGEYYDISLANVMRAMFRFNALDLGDRDIIQDYTFVTECELVTAFLDTDFKWDQVIDAVRIDIQNNKNDFPSRFRFDTAMRLSRFDARTKMFYFTEDTKIDGINSIQLISVNKDMLCYRNKLERLYVFPNVFRAVFPSYIYLEGIPMQDREARVLISRMDRIGNNKRAIFVTYKMSIAYIVPFAIEDNIFGGKEAKYYQGKVNTRDVRLNVRLDSIQFFEDPERTKLLYEYVP